MVSIIDYGVGNLFSLRSSFAAIGVEAEVTSDPETIRRADRVILPGVGAFGDAADKLRETGLDRVVREEAAHGKPLMGICLGMQLLFDLKIPQMGWNALKIVRESPLFKYTKDGEYVYFVHSYSAVNCEESLLASTEYGADLTACVGKDNVFGCQFHPEKSGETGLRMLKAFCETEAGV